MWRAHIRRPHPRGAFTTLLSTVHIHDLRTSKRTDKYGTPAAPRWRCADHPSRRTKHRPPPDRQAACMHLERCGPAAAGGCGLRVVELARRRPLARSYTIPPLSRCSFMTTCRAMAAAAGHAARRGRSASAPCRRRTRPPQRLPLAPCSHPSPRPPSPLPPPPSVYFSQVLPSLEILAMFRAQHPLEVLLPVHYNVLPAALVARWVRRRRRGSVACHKNVAWARLSYF